MQALLSRLESLFEVTGANAGHEFRDDPYRRRIADLRGLDEGLDELARGADPGELICFEAISIHPHALPSVVPAPMTGRHVTWMLDEGRVVPGDAALAELYAPNPTNRHLRMLHAVYCD